jgi:glutathione peroxidase-family protein
MIRKITTVFFVLTMVLSFGLKAQYAVGDEIMPINLLNIDDEMFSTENAEDVDGFIIVFTCNHCPYAVMYEDRLNELDAKYAEKGYPVLAINPNDAEAYPSDDYAAMKVRAEEKGFTFPYLHDETQVVAKTFGASRTPHTYVVQKNDDGKFIVKYIGAIDDDPRGGEPDTKYVEDAVDALIKGKKVKTDNTKAIGCSIKWKKA